MKEELECLTTPLTFAGFAGARPGCRRRAGGVAAAGPASEELPEEPRWPLAPARQEETAREHGLWCDPARAQGPAQDHLRLLSSLTKLHSAEDRRVVLAPSASTALTAPSVPSGPSPNRAPFSAKLGESFFTPTFRLIDSSDRGPSSSAFLLTRQFSWSTAGLDR